MDMKVIFKRIVISALAILMLLPCVAFPGSAAGQEQAYSYVYDSYGNANESPSPYQTDSRIDVTAFGLTPLKAASSLFVREDELYICDTGNHRIIQLSLANDTVELVRLIDSAADGSALSGPTDVFVTADGRMVVSDAGNNRILIMDSELNVLSEIRRPTDVSVDQTLPFKPNKLVVTAEHIYAQVQSVNKGLMEFSLDGDFVGYIGASPVKFNWEDYLWKVFSTDEQREAMQAFVPTEYNNVALDSEGFLYVTNSIFSKQELNAGDAEPVRRLNLKGTNILIQNGNNRVIGDLRWDSLGPSKFVDVTALDDGTYFLLDSVRSRIFAYDYQGNMLYAFGGIGTKSGYFTTPVSIEHHGKDLLVLDSANGMITVMKHTGFGELVANAISAYGVGDYNTSMEYWKQVLVLNGSYELAYRGIGKVLLRNGDYVEALDYLEYAKDYYYYSKAWQSYRKDWIESNILYIVGGLALLAVAYLVYSLITKIRGKVEYYEMWHPSAGTEN